MHDVLGVLQYETKHKIGEIDIIINILQLVYTTFIDGGTSGAQGAWAVPKHSVALYLLDKKIWDFTPVKYFAFLHC